MIDGTAFGESQAVLFVIESCPLTLRFVEHVLRRRRPGLRVVVFHSYRLAMDLAKVSPPDLFLVNVDHGYHCHHFLQLLGKYPETRHTPLLGMGFDQGTLRHYEKRAIFRELLPFPLEIARFLSAIDRHLPATSPSLAPALGTTP